jgi:hypothetical protein
MIQNISNATMGLYDLSTYNTGCLAELQKVADACSKFRVDVLQIYNTRMIYALIIVFLLIMFQIYIYRAEPEFSKTEFWQKYITRKIDLTIIFLMTGILYIMIAI